MTPAIFALLLALASGERHGYALMSDVAALTGGLVQLGPGTLYRSLQRMRVDGLITELEDDDEPAEEPADRRSERRRRYEITDKGRQAAAQEAGRLAALLAAARARGIQPVAILAQKETG